MTCLCLVPINSRMRSEVDALQITHTQLNSILIHALLYCFSGWYTVLNQPPLRYTSQPTTEIELLAQLLHCSNDTGEYHQPHLKLV